MTTIIPTDSTQTAQNELRKRDSESGQFQASLDLQSVALLTAMLDPAQTASLPGAGAALVQAESADQDIVAQAAGELARGKDRLGSRGRGQDASSQARELLGQTGSGQTTADAADLPNQQTSRDIAQQKSAESYTPDHQRFAKAQPESRESGTQANGAMRPDAGGEREFIKTETNENEASARAGRRGEGAFSAISSTQFGAASSGVLASNTNAGVSQVGSAGRVTPPVGPGQIADQRAGMTSASKQILRHEPRNIEAQLQRGLAQVLRQKGGTLSLRLNPVDLGEVKISLSVAQGRVDGTIEASNKQAYGLLEQNLEKLKSSLEQRGITVDRLEVRLAGAAGNERQIAVGQDAQANQDQQQADAGSDRQQDSASGEDRHRGDRGRIPDESVRAGLRGAESAADDDAAHGRAAEPLGGWLRLDTLA